jgi:hypothetical protein
LAGWLCFLFFAIVDRIVLFQIQQIEKEVLPWKRRRCDKQSQVAAKGRSEGKMQRESEREAKANKRHRVQKGGREEKVGGDLTVRATP